MLQEINNNIINVYQNKYIIEIKELYHKLEKEKEKRLNIYMDTGIKWGNDQVDKLIKMATMEKEIKVPLNDITGYRRIQARDMDKTQDNKRSQL